MMKSMIQNIIAKHPQVVCGIYGGVMILGAITVFHAGYNSDLSSEVVPSVEYILAHRENLPVPLTWCRENPAKVSRYVYGRQACANAEKAGFIIRNAEPN